MCGWEQTLWSFLSARRNHAPIRWLTPSFCKNPSQNGCPPQSGRWQKGHKKQTFAKLARTNEKQIRVGFILQHFYVHGFIHVGIVLSLYALIITATVLIFNIISLSPNPSLIRWYRRIHIIKSMLSLKPGVADGLMYGTPIGYFCNLSVKLILYHPIQEL